MRRLQRHVTTDKRSHRAVGLAFCAILLAAAVACGLRSQVHAQASASPARALITQTINEANLATLPGNTRPEARNPANDQGRVDDSLPMPHLQIQLRRPAAQEQALDALIEQLHDPQSPNYRHWLNPSQLGAQFGPAPSDVATVTDWLRQHGFTVNTIYPNGLTIDFSGTAGQVGAAFHTEIHHLSVKGVAHIANMSDPQIPAALTPTVVGIVALHDFSPHPQMKPKRQFTISNCDDINGFNCYALTPADLATIYNFNPLYSQGITGAGQSIYVVEDTDLYTSNDWTTFRSTFGLAGYTGASLNTIHPQVNGGNNCSDPGVNSDSGEAALDVEWASAAAPNAAIVLASCAGANGVTTAALNLVNASSPPAIISVSYGECESQIGAAGNSAINSMWQQGVAEGISIFVSAGDEGAAGCDDPDTESAASGGLAVNGLASTIYNVATGGTDFSDAASVTTSTYWSASNSSTYGSALSYIPEMPWNDSCANQVLFNVFGYATAYGSDGFCNSKENWAGSGGPSTGETDFLSISSGSGGPSQVYAKPSWQNGIAGNPADGVRDLPDVSLFAANGIWSHYYVFCWSDSHYRDDGQRIELHQSANQFHGRLGRDVFRRPDLGRHPGPHKPIHRHQAGQSQSDLLRACIARIRRRRKQYMQFE